MMSSPTNRLLLLLLLLAVAGCRGCFPRSTKPPPAPATTTTTQAPVVEERITADAAANSERGNAWASGGGIDWTHVGPGGHGNRGGSSTSGGSRGSSASPSRGSSPSTGGSSPSSGSAITPPATPQPVSRGELRILSEELLALDTNAVGSLVVLNTQGRTSSSSNTDAAPNRLFTSVAPEALSGPTISKLLTLLDNYDPSVTRRETDTSQERQEIQDFLDAVMGTSVMAKAEEFLRTKGLIRTPLRQVLEEIWFTTYPRSRQTMSSSGFEHVFVGEVKGRKVTGFHNWITFYKEEQEGDLDYFGYMKTADIGTKGDIIMLKFNWLDDPKPIGSMFVGTSPELDMALYTVCFYSRPGNNCPISLGGFRLSIKTYYQNYKGKKYVGTAFPNL